MQQPAATTQRTILLVEDDDDARRVYSVMLNQAGYHVVEAINGADAVECALERTPDLILMDMNLPMVDGWEAARRIKADPRARGTPLIAFSALIDSIADLRRDSALFDGFIAKPVRADDLVRRVAAYVELLAPLPKRPAEPTQSTRARRGPSGRVAQAGRALQ